MQWWRGDSELLANDKIIELDSQDAFTLWVVANLSCSQAETDGVIKPGRLRSMFTSAYLDTRARQNKAIKRLVAVKLWHDHTTIGSCEDCLAEFEQLEPGEYCVHNWNDHNPRRDDKTDPAKAFKANRKRRLKKLSTLKEQIRRRDRGYCRYCAFRVTMSDHTSADGFTYDHIDPDGDNTLENVVTSCRGCNQHKGERTPAEAGMRLLPPPEPGVAPQCPPGGRPFQTAQGAGSEPVPEPVPAGTRAGTGTGSEPVPSSVGTGSEQGPEPVPPSRSAQLGPEPARSRLGTGSGPGSAGLGPAGLGSALLGPARNGPVGFGQVGHGSLREPPSGGTPDPPPDRTLAAASTAEDPST
jgi:5-methylcytosine-specific restriction endonuclease McrA